MIRLKTVSVDGLQWIGLHMVAAALISLGCTFSWATGVAVGMLKIGHGIEPVVFHISAGLPVSLAVLGLFLMVPAEVISFFQRRSDAQRA